MKKIFCILLIFSYFILDNQGDQVLTLEMTSSNSLEYRETLSLRVFNNAELKSYTDYYINEDSLKLRLTNQQIFGFCLLKDIDIQRMTVNSEDVTWLEKPLNDSCQHQTSPKKHNTKIKTKQTIIAHIFASLLLSFLGILLIYCLKASHRSYKQDPVLLKRLSLLSFATLAILAFWYSITSPGLFDYDLLGSYSQVKNFESNGWFSFLNNLLLESCFIIFDNLGTIQVFSLLFSWILFTLYLKILLKLKGAKYSIIFFFSLLMYPSIGLGLNYISRDLIIVQLHLALFLGLLYSYFGYVNKIRVGFIDVALLVAAVSASTFRRETILSALVFFTFYLILNKFKKKKVFLLVLSGIILKITFISADYYLETSNKTTQVKMIFSLSHTISTMITNNYATKSRTGDRNVINQYYKYEQLAKYHRDNNILHTQKGAVLTPEKTDLKPLYGLVLKMIKDNPILYIKSRIKMMIYTLGGNEKTIFYPHGLKLLPNFDNKKEKELYNENAFYKFKNIKTNQGDRYYWSIINSQFKYSLLQNTYNAFIPLIIAILSIILFNRTPLSCICSCVFLIRLPIFFFLLPASQFKYILDVHIYGYLILPILIWELKYKETRDIKKTVLTLINHLKSIFVKRI